MRLQVIPWGKAMEKLLSRKTTFQVVLSLYPTLFSLDGKGWPKARGGLRAECQHWERAGGFGSAVSPPPPFQADGHRSTAEFLLTTPHPQAP